jgi:hypothetical protein
MHTKKMTDIQKLSQHNQHLNGFYYGDLPGTLQYNKDPNEILEINMNIKSNSYDDGWILTEHSKDNLARLTPDTANGKQNWRILLIIEKEVEKDIIMLKGALQNRSTNKILFVSSANSKQYHLDNNNRCIKSLDDEWFVGHYRMVAPLLFWNELKNRLLYSV